MNKINVQNQSYHYTEYSMRCNVFLRFKTDPHYTLLAVLMHDTLHACHYDIKTDHIYVTQLLMFGNCTHKITLSDRYPGSRPTHSSQSESFGFLSLFFIFLICSFGFGERVTRTFFMR